MRTQIRQGDIVYIDFDSHHGAEIQKRRPALVMSKTGYNVQSHLIIVCPITTSHQSGKWLIPINHKKLRKSSKVNISQVYSFDCTKCGSRHVRFAGSLKHHIFLKIAQSFFFSNFDIPVRARIR